MSNRDYKEFAPGTISHIYNRGNNRENIFHDDEDYKAFIYRLGQALGYEKEELTHELCALPYSRIRITGMSRNAFKLHAFSLMPNHFHLLLEQCGNISISVLISKVCTSFAKYINKKYGHVGHVFQDKFKAVLTQSNPQLMWSSSYIHMNPVKDGFVNDPANYRWSSYNDFVSDRGLPIITTDFLISVFGDRDSFKKETLRFSTDELVSKTVFDMF